MQRQRTVQRKIRSLTYAIGKTARGRSTSSTILNFMLTLSLERSCCQTRLSSMSGRRIPFLSRTRVRTRLATTNSMNVLMRPPISSGWETRRTWEGVGWRFPTDEPLVLPPHQVAVVKTHEEVNVPRFLIARWNLRVKWVYEGLLWVGGPQVDPGWQGALYCPIYNLAEREVVIPYMERVFTMDFTRTTPFHEKKASYGYKSKPHKPSRQPNLQGHDVNRLHSAPFSALSQLATLDTRVTAFSSLTFLALAVVIAAIGVIAALNNGAAAFRQEITGNTGLFVLAVVALVFGFSGLVISSIAMATKFGQPPRGRWRLTLMALFGIISLSVGAAYGGVLVTSGLPDFPTAVKLAAVIAPSALAFIGVGLLVFVWIRATRSSPIKVDLRLPWLPFGMGSSGAPDR